MAMASNTGGHLEVETVVEVSQQSFTCKLFFTCCPMLFCTCCVGGIVIGLSYVDVCFLVWPNGVMYHVILAGLLEGQAGLFHVVPGPQVAQGEGGCQL
jgi:hypothetical protein